MEQFRFLFPLDGDCLTSRDGVLEDGALWVEVRVAAPSGSGVTVNGVPARETEPGLWSVRLPLDWGKTELLARGASESSIAVFRLKGGEKGFRLSVDDNLLFLADLTENRERYRSIFENPYLAMYKRIHEETGVCVHLNLFYETGDLSEFSMPRPYFNLSMMTDRFREEWRANAHWLKMSFHARSEFPDCPYSTPEPEKIAADCRRVQEEICRFAGEECLSRVTTVHFCACPVENLRALRELGVRGFTGFCGDEDDVVLAYCYPKDIARRVAQRHFWVDTKEQLLCGRIDAILNTIPPKELPERLEHIWATGGKSGFVEFMIHEQYFYPDYDFYIPEFEDMVRMACRSARERGYEGRGLSGLLDL